MDGGATDTGDGGLTGTGDSGGTGQTGAGAFPLPPTNELVTGPSKTRRDKPADPELTAA